VPVKIADVRDEPACVCFMHWQQDQSLSSERRRTGKHAEGSLSDSLSLGKQH